MSAVCQTISLKANGRVPRLHLRKKSKWAGTQTTPEVSQIVILCEMPIQWEQSCLEIHSLFILQYAQVHGLAVACILACTSNIMCTSALWCTQT